MSMMVASCDWSAVLCRENLVCAVGVAMFVALLCFAMKRRIWMVLIGVAVFLFGVGVYMGWLGWMLQPSTSTTADGVMEAFSRSLSAFYPSRGDYESEFSQSYLYWLFHFFAILYITAIIVMLFGTEFVNRGFLLCRRLAGRPMNVFWGFCEEAKTIASGVVEGKDSVVFVMPEKRLWTGLDDDEDVHEVARSGWKWVLGGSGEMQWLSAAKRHFFMGPDGHRNVALAEALIRSYKGGDGISVYVRISATADDDVLYKWADKWNGDADKNVEVVVVREESLVSRRFLLDNPMLQCPRIAIDTTTATVSGDFKVLLLGFGSQGEMLLNDMICDSQYLTSGGEAVPFEVHVFDRDRAAYGGYEELCQEAVSCYHVKFDCLEIGSSLFWRRFRNEMAQRPYNRVVVCLRDDRENISIASDIARVYREMHLSPCGVVYARVRDSLIDAYVESTFEAEVPKRSFAPFGAISGTYSFGNIVTRKWEKGAVWLNGDWGMEPNAKHDDKKDAAAWKSAPFFNKESSRASFFHQRNLLRLIGYQVDENSDDNMHFNDNDPKNHLDVLAEDEHMRWMAFHFVRGIRVWRPTKDEIDEIAHRTGRKVKHNMIGELNAHADLVPYADLPKVDALFDPINERHGHKRGKDTQEKDKGFVRSEAMKRSGLGTRKS